MNGIPGAQMLEGVPLANPIILTEKKCIRCGKIKKINNFYPDKRKKDKRYSSCKKCSRKIKAEWLKNNVEKIRKKNIIYRIKNKERYRESSRLWYNKNSKKCCEKSRSWQKKNPEKTLYYAHKWRLKNLKKMNDYKKKWAKQKRDSDSGFRLNGSLTSAINQSLKGNKKGKHWEQLVGYTLEQLKKYIEKQFTEGMTWENYGKYGWHIDHIIPISAFNFEKSEDADFKRCWALKNLQPLWAKENISKGNKLKKPFQPKLIFK